MHLALDIDGFPKRAEDSRGWSFRLGVIADTLSAAVLREKAPKLNALFMEEDACPAFLP